MLILAGVGALVGGIVVMVVREASGKEAAAAAQ